MLPVLDVFGCRCFCLLYPHSVDVCQATPIAAVLLHWLVSVAFQGSFELALCHPLDLCLDMHSFLQHFPHSLPVRHCRSLLLPPLVSAKASCSAGCTCSSTSTKAFTSTSTTSSGTSCTPCCPIHQHSPIVGFAYLCFGDFAGHYSDTFPVLLTM